MNLSDVTDLKAEDLLAATGLATRQTATARLLNFAGAFAAGALIGGIAALLLAPKSGRGLREDLGDSIRSVPEAFKKAIPDARTEAANNAV
jgi:YtxH-like protein